MLPFDSVSWWRQYTAQNPMYLNSRPRLRASSHPGHRTFKQGCRCAFSMIMEPIFSLGIMEPLKGIDCPAPILIAERPKQLFSVLSCIIEFSTWYRLPRLIPYRCKYYPRSRVHNKCLYYMLDHLIRGRASYHHLLVQMRSLNMSRGKNCQMYPTGLRNVATVGP